MSIGPRVLKTGIAVLVASIIVDYLFDAPILVAALAAAIATKPSVIHGFNYLREIFIGNILGAVIALGFYYVAGVSPLMISLTVMLCIIISVQLGFKDSINLTILTALVILGGAASELNGELNVISAIERLAQLLIGALSAFLVNTFLFPPKNEERVFNDIKSLIKEVALLLKVATRKSKSFNSHKKEILKLTSRLDDVKTSLTLLEDDLKRITFSKKKKINRLKRVLLYKQHVKVLEKQINLFRSLEIRFANFNNISEEQLVILKAYLDDVLLEQEFVLLEQEHRIHDNKFFDKESHAESLELTLRFNIQTLLVDIDSKNEESWWRLFPIITSCVDLKSDVVKLHKIHSKINYTKSAK